MNGWKNPILFILGIGISNIGNWIYFVAINLLILKLTGSASAVAGLFVIRPIAVLFTNTWAGSVIDRVNKRHLMVTIDVIRGILIGVVPFCSSLVSIYIIMFMTNVAGAIFGPASEAYTVKLIPPEKRKRFNSLFSFTTSGSMLLGPSLSGVLIAYGSIDMSITINSITFFLCALAIYLLPSVDDKKEKTYEQESISFKVISEDWREVFQFGKQTLGFMSVFILFQMMMIMAFALDSQEVTFIQQVLGLSEKNYGLLVSLTGSGYVLGSFVVTTLVNRFTIQWMIGMGSLLTASGYSLFYLSHGTEIWLAILGFFIIGFFSPFSYTGYSTFFQHHVPVKLMGRFSSTFSLFQALLQIAFTLLLGFLAESFDLRLVGPLSAILTLMLSFILIAVIVAQSKKEIFMVGNKKSF